MNNIIIFSYFTYVLLVFVKGQTTESTLESEATPDTHPPTTSESTEGTPDPETETTSENSSTPEKTTENGTNWSSTTEANSTSMSTPPVTTATTTSTTSAVKTTETKIPSTTTTAAPSSSTKGPKESDGALVIVVTVIAIVMFLLTCCICHKSRKSSPNASWNIRYRPLSCEPDEEVIRADLGQPSYTEEQHGQHANVQSPQVVDKYTEREVKPGQWDLINLHNMD